MDRLCRALMFLNQLARNIASLFRQDNISSGAVLTDRTNEVIPSEGAGACLQDVGDVLGAEGLKREAIGEAEDPGGAGAPWVQSFGENSRQVYATNTSSRAVHHLAVIPEAEQVRDLGVRFLLRPNDHVQTALRVFRDPSCQPAGCPRSRNAESHRLMGGSANGRMLRLGSQAATISCS